MKKLIWLFLLSTAFGQLSPSDKNAISINGHVTISGTVSIQSQAPFLESVLVSPATASIAVSATQQFAALAEYSDGTTNDVTNLCSWNSSSPSIATIGASGLATGVAAGTTNITCTYQSVASNTAVLTVTSAPAFAITTSDCPNGKQGTAYTCTIHSQNGSAPCTWSVSVGSLPTGLSLASPTNPCDPTTITGTPSGTGTSAFTILGTDNGAHTDTQAFSITINSSGACTGGPPHYACSSTSTTATGTLDPSQPYAFQNGDAVNTTRFDSTLNPSPVNCYTEIVDDATVGGGDGLFGWTYNGGSGTQQSSKNGTFIMFAQTNMKLMKVDTSGNCLQVTWPTPGHAVTDHGKGNAFFSTQVDTRFFQENSTKVEQADIDGVGTATHFNVTSTVFDFSQCPHTPGPGTSPANQTGWWGGGSDNYFAAGFSWTQFGECSGQGCAHNMYVVNAATHSCATLNLNGAVGGTQHFIDLYDWCNPDSNGHSGDHANCVNATPVASVANCANYDPSAKNSGFHGSSLDPSGTRLKAGYQCPGSPPAAAVLWLMGNGAHVSSDVRLGGVGPTTGHNRTGITMETEANNPNVASTPYSTYPTGTTNSYKNILFGESHPSWENTPQDDTWDAIYTISVGDGPPTYGTNLTSVCENEFCAFDMLNPFSSVPRLGHNFTTGQPNYGGVVTPHANQVGPKWACMYGQHWVSQDGNWLFFSSPYLGNFGPDSSGYQKCRGFALHIQ